MYSVTINKEIFAVEKTDDGFRVNESLVRGDLQAIDSRSFHFLKDNLSHRIELLDIDIPGKTLILKIKGKTTQVVIKDRFDLLLEKLNMGTSSTNRIGEIKAPMPGLILEIKVKEGDVIKKGDPLLILEAMKMENVLKSSSDGEIKEIFVSIGSSVEKNQVMIIFK